MYCNPLAIKQGSRGFFNVLRYFISLVHTKSHEYSLSTIWRKHLIVESILDRIQRRLRWWKIKVN
jgi:hypothetical protein